jgi:hypothetical protein
MTAPLSHGSDALIFTACSIYWSGVHGGDSAHSFSAGITNLHDKGLVRGVFIDHGWAISSRVGCGARHVV